MLFRLKPLYNLSTFDRKAAQPEGLEVGQDEDKKIGIGRVATIGLLTGPVYLPTSPRQAIKLDRAIKAPLKAGTFFADGAFPSAFGAPSFLGGTIISLSMSLKV
jgi:hypothetical protein